MNLTDLLQDPHILHVEEGEQWEPLDWSNVPGNQERLSEVYDVLMRDLSVGYCVDDFEVHSERQLYRTGENTELNSTMQKNSLRANYISGLVFATLAIRTAYRGQHFKEVSDESKRIYDGIVELMTSIKLPSGEVSCSYDQMKPFEKLAFVKDLKKQIYDVMKLVAEVSK
jgi:hypothetical protein